MINIANCQSLSEALMVQSVLQGAGIDAFIPDEFTVQNDWSLINAIGGIRVQIHPDDEIAAKEILSGNADGQNDEVKEN